MSQSFTRQEICLTIVQTVLLSLIAVSWLWMSEAKGAFQDSARNERDCRTLVAEIETLQAMGAVATEDRTESGFGNAQLLQTAVSCGMTENQVASFRRQTPVQIDGTDYRRQDLSVVLRDVTLEQLLSFGIRIESEYDTVKTSAINLISGRSLQRQYNGVKPSSVDAVKPPLNDPPETWNAELILTQMAYVATSATR